MSRVRHMKKYLYFKRNVYERDGSVIWARCDKCEVTYENEELYYLNRINGIQYGISKNDTDYFDVVIEDGEVN